MECEGRVYDDKILNKINSEYLKKVKKLAMLLLFPSSFLFLPTSPTSRPAVASKFQELHWSMRNVIGILHCSITEGIRYWSRGLFACSSFAF